MNKRKKPDIEVISYLDEIKLHCQMWIANTEFSKSNAYLKEALVGLYDICNMGGIIKTIEVDGGKNIGFIKDNRRKLIAMYKTMYRQKTDLFCEENIDPTTIVILDRLIEKLVNDGSSVEEYLKWFFDDFLSRKENSKFMPPNIKLFVSNFVITKFMYEMNDTMKQRKKDAKDSKRRLELIKLATIVYEKIHDKELGSLIIKFGKNQVAYGSMENYILSLSNKDELKEELKEFELCESISNIRKIGEENADKQSA